jgi:hypothetical protein
VSLSGRSEGCHRRGVAHSQHAILKRDIPGDLHELIAVRQSKTGKSLWIPIHSRLAEILAKIPRNGLYVLTSTHGQPWTVMGFKASWSAELNREIMKTMRERRRWCRYWKLAPRTRRWHRYKNRLT